MAQNEAEATRTAESLRQRGFMWSQIEIYMLQVLRIVPHVVQLAILEATSREAAAAERARRMLEGIESDRGIPVEALGLAHALPVLFGCGPLPEGPEIVR